MEFKKTMATIAVAAAMGAAFSASATTYYASPEGTGTGTEADPYSLSAGIAKVAGKSHTLILKSGRYLLDGAVAFNGTTSGDPTTVCGETGNPEDVILDAQGKSEVMRINQNVIISGITMMNGSNKDFASSAYGSRASGVRVGWTSAPDTHSVVSNCVITCCTNEFTSDTKVISGTSTNEVCGGAVAVFENGLLLNSVVTNNTAVYRCGGVVILKKGVVRNCLIADNSAVNDGGGLFVERNATGALVADSTISGNRVTGGNGAGVANINPSTSITLANCTITGNTASNVGGGLYLSNSTTTQCQDCRIEQNEARSGGGTRIIGQAKGLFNECVFDGNTANSDLEGQNSFGGGACFANDQSGTGIASFTNCVFRNNTSAGRGGAFFGGWGRLTRAEFVGCVITNNSCKRQGGGVCVRDDKRDSLDTRFFIRNCLVAHNRTTSTTTSDDTSGAGVYLVAYANPVVDSCTIVSNALAPNASGNGGGLYQRWGGTVTNTIVAFNLKNNSLETTSNWCLNVGTPSDAYHNCCVWPAATSAFLAANGCVNADPMFADAANDDFTLALNSPCKNAGLLESWMDGAFDLAGNKRVYGDIPDIGCYELRYPKGLVISFR